MGDHFLSESDLQFRSAFEACTCTPDSFTHRAHIQLAYAYLAEHDVEAALSLVRRALQTFIAHHDIPPAKYHETITRAWILAVRHFMESSPGARSADEFIDANPRLLDAGIMMTHYSAELLFSDSARAEFVDPDLEEIPRYGDPGRE